MVLVILLKIFSNLVRLKSYKMVDKNNYYVFKFNGDGISPTPSNPAYFQIIEECINNNIFKKPFEFDKSLIIVNFSGRKLYYITIEYVSSIITNLNLTIQGNTPPQIKTRYQKLLDCLLKEYSINTANGSKLDDLIVFFKNTGSTWEIAQSF